MTKLSKKLLLVVLALTLVLTLTLAACKTEATVSFVGGDGATGTAPDAINTTVGETIQLPENTFTKQGYVFAGWKYGDTVLQPKAMYLVESASVEFVAQWTAEEPEPEVTLTSITATYDGTIELNGLYDSQKMVVTAHYSDGSSHAVDGYLVEVDTSVAGNAQAEISYSEGGVTKTCNVTIEVVAAAPTTYALAYAAGDHATGAAPAAEQKEAGAKVTLAAATLFTAESGYEFDGWSDGTTKYAAGAEFTMPAKAVTLTAQWKLIKHTVTFKPGEELENKTLQVEHGQKIVTNQIPVFEHPQQKVIEGWYTEDSEKFDFETAITSDITLEATWRWIVTFESGEGATGTISPEYVRSYGNVTLPEGTALSKEGYEFAGWTDGEKNYKAGDVVRSVSGNLTFTALWKEKVNGYTVEYAITFRAEGTAPATVVKNEGDTITLPDQTGFSVKSEHSQYVFKGWKNLTDQKIYQPGDTYTMPAANIKFQAVWEVGSTPEPAQQYTVTYKTGEHGTGTDVVETLNAGKITLKGNDTFTAQGYALVGWQLVGGTEEDVYDVGKEYTLSQNVAFVAIWTEVYVVYENDYKCTLIMYPAMYSGFLDIDEQIVEFVVEIEGTKITITLESGAEFVGTYDSNGLVISIKIGATTYNFGQAQPEPAQQYTVTWIKASDDSLIGSVVGDVPAQQQVTAGSKITAPAADTLTLANYTLLSWRVYELIIPTDGTDAYWGVMNVNGSAVNIAPGAEYTMPAKNIQIKAVWTGSQATVSFDPNGGTGTMPSVQKSYTGYLGINLIDCTFTAPDGKEFAGWSLSSDGAIITADNDPKIADIVGDNGAITLYAIWQSAAVVPTTPLIDEIKGSWTATGHTIDIISAQNESNSYVKGYAILDGNYLLEIIDNGNTYGAYTLDHVDSYVVSCSDETLTLTPVSGIALTFASKTELTNAAHSTFEGKWLKSGTTQKWIVTADQAYYGTTSISKASLSVVIGNNIVLVYEVSGYNYVYVLAKQGENLEGWYQAPEYEPVATTFVPGDYLTLTVDGELNQTVNSGSAPDANKIVAPAAPEGQVFSKWVIAGTQTEFDTTAEMTQDLAIEAVFVDDEGESNAQTYIGACTVTFGSGLLEQNYTVTQFVIDFNKLEASAIINGKEAEITELKLESSVPSTVAEIYKEGETYYSLNIKYGITTADQYIVVNADKTKLTLCNNQDEPYTNGEFLLQDDSGNQDDPDNGEWVSFTIDTECANSTILYFENSFENGTITFLGIQFTKNSLGALGINPIYVNSGSEKIGSRIGLATTPNANPNLMDFHSGSYDITIGKKADGKFYVVSFSYKSNVDTTERELSSTTCPEF